MIRQKIFLTLTTLLIAISSAACLNTEIVEKKSASTQKSTPKPVAPKPAVSLYDQQKKVYFEAKTGKFYELFHSGKRSFGQLSLHGFEVDQIEKTSDCKTGSQSWAIKIEPAQVLRVEINDSISCKPFLLGLLGAKFKNYRNDLQISFVYADDAKITWSNLQTKPGWNEILVDLQEKRDSKLFDADIKAVEISFTNSKSPVEIKLNDILLVNNSKNLFDVKGLKIRRSGLGWSVWNRAGNLLLKVENTEGLIRLTDPGVEVVFKKLNKSATEKFLSESKSLSLIGKNIISSCDLLELNKLRMRLKISWLFPSQLGGWSPVYAKQIQFFVTVYPDGRIFYQTAFKNLRYSAFKKISAAEIKFASPGQENTGFVWQNGIRSNRLLVNDLISEMQKFSCLSLYSSIFPAPEIIPNFLKPSKIDQLRFIKFIGFDKSTGQYVLKTHSDKSSFRLNLNKNSKLFNPVFLIKGSFEKMPIVSSGGESISTKVLTKSGDLLFVLNKNVIAPVVIEIAKSEK